MGTCGLVGDDCKCVVPPGGTWSDVQETFWYQSTSPCSTYKKRRAKIRLSFCSSRQEAESGLRFRLEWDSLEVPIASRSTALGSGPLLWVTLWPWAIAQACRCQSSTKVPVLAAQRGLVMKPGYERGTRAGFAFSTPLA